MTTNTVNQSSTILNRPLKRIRALDRTGALMKIDYTRYYFYADARVCFAFKWIPACSLAQTSTTRKEILVLFLVLRNS